MDIINSMLHQIAFEFHPEVFPEFLAGYAAVIFWIAVGYALHMVPASIDKHAETFVTWLPLVGKAVLISLIVAVIMQVKSSEIQPFIYFQF